MNQGAILKRLSKAAGYTQDELAQKLGVSRVTVNSLMKQAELSGDYIERTSAILKVNRDVFTKGIGDDVINALATNNSANGNDGNATPANTENIMYVPLVQQYAYAGYLSGFADAEYIEELPRIPFIVDREHKGNYRAFQVRGDSMDDGTLRSYPAGCILLGREIAQHHWANKLHFKKWRFIIVHKTLGIIVKEIIAHDTVKQVITLHSYNIEFDDFNVSLTDVHQIFSVVKKTMDE